MSPEEQAALDILRTRVAHEREMAFSLFRDLDRDPSSLKTCGFKTIEEAALHIMRGTLQDIVKLNNEFVKQFPDS